MIEVRLAIEDSKDSGLSLEVVRSLTTEEVESLIQVKLKVLYPTKVIRQEISEAKRCILISDLGLLEEVRPMQVIVADPPPSKEEIRFTKERERAQRLAEEIRYLSGLERPKGRHPTHRHPI
ncbi:MAG: hypothetical protein UU73_C0002G0068 [Candidatus Daviesbacteria bacterium GW2011_GWA1_41_61]|uniref:Uncharacterized protein n=1 Tax=Candidatus Daviesbacteria bacterium GW2011_GWA2_40_9 TaxID=1618424 RepID=A0A0G0U6I5_9BACT|nr:MAG: hypothetical protein UU26_C0039G0004 [Candidatus Daviesbacteria bacterium GW2011_GWC1_40_9]KKR82811.1 MAG: hypothetical protein UU29_C0009G0082 [Candidatus Daviesbacteria bacterium GW2011_GWA2_40_9]KKR93728.1 MAG: hypothetical protein UU44_C0001G0068 [Candidatus Daviesbacteria bacterium GW2011_GWB1_41_15]KKS15194.1 MAG: hypothetical protein UU73_C0002G0068 [Candidatus Daviesbacteria bacterium GW2011_GWA1_41_61]